MMRSTHTPGPDYGLDAPGLGRGLFVAGIVSAGLGLLVGRGPGRSAAGANRQRRRVAGRRGLLSGDGRPMRYASKVGKLRERERLLDLIAWSGDESVLDVGCGRGLMLVGAARRSDVRPMPSAWMSGGRWTRRVTVPMPRWRTPGRKALPTGLGPDRRRAVAPVRG